MAIRGGRVAALSLLLVLGCGGTARRPLQVEEGLTDPDPARRTRAVLLVRAHADRERVPDLIGLLDDEDPAVRLAASGSLEKLTGHHTSYVPWAPPESQREAIRDWRAWWAANGGASATRPGGTP